MSKRMRFLAALAFFTFIAGVGVGIIDSGDATGSPTEEESKAIPERPSPVKRADSGCLADPIVLDEIKEQREKLARAQKELVARETELKARETAMAEELKKLEALRDEIGKTDAIKKKENQEKLAKLLETLETMSPKASAKMMAELDDTLAVTVLQRLDTVKLAKIMNLLEPKRASKLSEILTGVARTKIAPSAPVAVAANTTTKTTTNEKGGEKNDGQNRENSSSSSEGAQRQPSSGRAR